MRRRLLPAPRRRPASGLATAAAGETSRISAEGRRPPTSFSRSVDPEAVPADFTGRARAPLLRHPPGGGRRGGDLESADPFAGRLLARALQRPSLAHEAVSPSGRFRFHYDTEGRDAVDPADADGNGVPDYVDLAMTLADSAWHVQVEVLGYQEPPLGRRCQGGGDEIDIYLDRPGPLPALRPDLSDNCGGDSGPSYLEIDNDFENPVFGNASLCEGYRGSRGLDALRVTLAHEFFHAVQFGYYQGLRRQPGGRRLRPRGWRTSSTPG